MIILFQPNFDTIETPKRLAGSEPEQGDLIQLSAGVQSLADQIAANPNNVVTRSLEELDKNPFNTQHVNAQLRVIEDSIVKALSETSSNDSTYWVIDEKVKVETKFSIYEKFETHPALGTTGGTIIKLSEKDQYAIRITTGIYSRGNYVGGSYMEKYSDGRLGCRPHSLHIDIMKLNDEQKKTIHTEFQEA